MDNEISAIESEIQSAHFTRLFTCSIEASRNCVVVDCFGDMTVTYTGDVANANIKAFLKTIFRWKGSVWKAVYLELGIWSLSYAILSIIYRNALTEDQRDLFEKIVLFCYKYGDFIPLTFMLGFYVNLVVQRWMKMFHNLGWIDDISLLTVSYIHGADEKSRMIRRSIVRYLCLVQVMVFRAISIGIRKRFPTFDTLVASGYLTASERDSLAETQFYLPARWAMSLVRNARADGRIHSDQAVQDLYSEITDFRTRVVALWLYDWVPVPLVYTQVVFLTVRMYFILSIMGRQYIDVDKHPIRGPVDAYVPFFTILQFTFYVGWMKVAEALLNPFGDDDDDFECNWIIDRNLQAGLVIVDGDGFQPDPCIDKFWDDQHGVVHMYTAETVNQPQNPIRGSAVDAVAKLRTNEAIIMVPRPLQSAENLESLNAAASRKTSVSSNFATRIAGSLRSAFGSSVQLDKKGLSLSKIPESEQENPSRMSKLNGSLQEARKRRCSVNVAEISAQQLKNEKPSSPIIVPSNSQRRFSNPEKSGLAAVDEIDEQISSASDEQNAKEVKRVESTTTTPFCVSANDCYASMSLSPESSDENDDDDEKRVKGLFKEEHNGKKFF